MLKENWMQIGKPHKRKKCKGGVFQMGNNMYLNIEELTPGMKKNLMERCTYCGSLLINSGCGNPLCKSNKIKKI